MNFRLRVFGKFGKKSLYLIGEFLLDKKFDPHTCVQHTTQNDFGHRFRSSRSKSSEEGARLGALKRLR